MPGGERHASPTLEQHQAGTRTRSMRFRLQHKAASRCRDASGPLWSTSSHQGVTCSSLARRSRWPLQAGPRHRTRRRGRHAPVPAVATGPSAGGRRQTRRSHTRSPVCASLGGLSRNPLALGVALTSLFQLLERSHGSCLLARGTPWILPVSRPGSPALTTPTLGAFDTLREMNKSTPSLRAAAVDTAAHGHRGRKAQLTAVRACTCSGGLKASRVTAGFHGLSYRPPKHCVFYELFEQFLPNITDT